MKRPVAPDMSYLQAWHPLAPDYLRELELYATFLESKLPQATISVRSVSDEQAKKEVMAVFDSATGKLYYSDLEESLNLDYEQVIRVCVTLEQEGKIEVFEEPL